MGRPIELAGTVVRGDRRARRLGFPTANVRLTGTLLPARGVYHVWLEHGGHRREGLMNLGVRPTFGKSALTCEVHLTGFRGSLYGRSVRIFVMERLRPERRFHTPEALARQIRRDLAHAGLRYPHP